MRYALQIALALLPLAACQDKPAELAVTKGWVRLPAVPGGTAAAYFTIKGGAAPDRLLRVSSEVATRAELHESMAQGDRMSMRPIDGVDVAPGATVEFKPGGKHVMLYGMSSRTQPGTAVRLTFTFADGDELVVDAPTQAANAPVKG